MDWDVRVNNNQLCEPKGLVIVKIIEFFLQSLAQLAGMFRFLMPTSIWFSIQYLQNRYKAALLEKDNETRMNRLHHLAQLRKKLHPPTENYMIQMNTEDGTLLRANICQNYCGDMYYGLSFEQDELDLVRQFVCSGDIFFDVGANIGIYSLLASNLVGEKGEVHAFEPLASAYQSLKENVELNRARNVRVNPVAVGDKAGEMDLYVNAQTALTGLGRTNRGILLGIQKVPVWTLDDYVALNGIRTIDFLKIDVEGFEGQVLRGAARLIANSPNLIIMSELAKKNFEPLGFSVKELLDWMRGLEFDAWMIRHDGAGLQYVPANSIEYPFQNFIFMRRSNKQYALLKGYEKVKMK